MTNPTPGAGHNPLVLEQTINASWPNGGYFADRIVSINELCITSGAALGTTAGAEPFKAASGLATGLHVVRWRQDAGAANVAIWSQPLPGEYDPQRDVLRVLACLRKTDGGADENNDLAFQVNAKFLFPGYADPSIAAAAVPVPVNGDAAYGANNALAAPVLRTLPGPVASNSPLFHWYQFDLSLDVARTAARRWKPMHVISLEIGPNETLGTTDMTVDMIGLMTRFVRSATLNDRDSRTSANRIRA